MFPVGDHHARLREGPEDAEVEAFVADSGVERLDVAVAPRFTTWDERRADAFTSPPGHRLTGQLGTVGAAQHRRIATVQGDAIELVDDPVAGDRAIHEPA